VQGEIAQKLVDGYKPVESMDYKTEVPCEGGTYSGKWSKFGEPGFDFFVRLFLKADEDGTGHLGQRGSD